MNDKPLRHYWLIISIHQIRNNNFHKLATLKINVLMVGIFLNQTFVNYVLTFNDVNINPSIQDTVTLDTDQTISFRPFVRILLYSSANHRFAQICIFHTCDYFYNTCQIPLTFPVLCTSWYARLEVYRVGWWQTTVQDCVSLIVGMKPLDIFYNT